MIELSEQDMANLVKAEQEWIASKNDSRYVLREYCYRAGLAAGIERAAKVCDERERANAHSVGRSNGCAECAAAIRLLNAHATP